MRPAATAGLFYCMNTVLQFAINNQRKAERLLAAIYGIPRDDLDDLGQIVLLRIFRADPRDCKYLHQYWMITVRSVAWQWWRDRRRRQPPVHLDESIEGDWLADPAQDPVQTQETREEIQAALSQANERERVALARLLGSPEPLSGGDRVAIHRFRRRRRLRGATA